VTTQAYGKTLSDNCFRSECCTDRPRPCHCLLGNNSMPPIVLGVVLRCTERSATHCPCACVLNSRILRHSQGTRRCTHHSSTKHINPPIGCPNTVVLTLWPSVAAPGTSYWYLYYGPYLVSVSHAPVCPIGVGVSPRNCVICRPLKLSVDHPPWSHLYSEKY
jgi:hypothetical protein